MVEAVQHTSLLAQCRTDATGEFWKGIGTIQQAVSQLPVALIQRIVPLRGFVAQRTSPVAKGHTAVHAARGLQLTFAGVERLLYLAKVVYSIVNRAVTSLLTMYL